MGLGIEEGGALECGIGLIESVSVFWCALGSHLMISDPELPDMGPRI